MSDFSQIVNDLATKLNSLPSRQETLKKCIQEKLQYSEEMYLSQVEKARNYLLSRDNLKVIKTIVRENKKKGV